MYAAAHNLDIEWVVIKGISGYADGRKVKDSWREFASFMAASLMAHILSDTVAFQALQHYGSASEYWTFRKHVEFSNAISYSFLRLSCGFGPLIIPPVNLLRSLLPTNLKFALQFKE